MNPNATTQNKPRSRVQQWMKLFVALMLLGLLVVTVIPWITHLPTINSMIESNNAQGIDATGLFYTETSEFAQSENYLRNLKIQN